MAIASGVAPLLHFATSGHRMAFPLSKAREEGPTAVNLLATDLDSIENTVNSPIRPRESTDPGHNVLDQIHLPIQLIRDTASLTGRASAGLPTTVGKPLHPRDAAPSKAQKVYYATDATTSFKLFTR